MTVVIEFDRLKFKVNQNDHNPPHVHVEGYGASVRINLNTLEMMDDHTDFSIPTMRKILAKVEENVGILLGEWEKLHGKK